MGFNSNLLVVSDLHLNPQSTERNTSFIKFLERAVESRDRVLVLGDLFDLWFGWEHLRFSFQVDIFNKMNNLATDGLWIEYVEGNRDFGISQLQGRLFRKVYETRAELKWGERIIYAEHGDLINKADRPYLTFRKLTKNRFTYFVISHLPAKLLLRFAAKLEKNLKNTNQEFRIGYPEDHCRNFREEAFRHGADIVLAGHFHQERAIKEQLNSRTVLFYNLPGWETGFRYLVIPESKEEPYFKEFSE